MSKNIKLNNTDYNGVSTVQLPTTDGGKATFKDVDEITGGGASIELKGTYTVKTTGYFYSQSTLDNEAITASYDNGMLALIVSDADEDWSDVTTNGARRIIVYYTTEKHIMTADGYRCENSKQHGGTAQPLTRANTGKGNLVVNNVTDYGNQYTLNLNSGQTVKKYEMELERSVVESLMYFGS